MSATLFHAYGPDDVPPLDGKTCPTCTRRVHVYRRSVDQQMAGGLRQMHRAYGADYGHMPSVVAQIGAKGSGDMAKLRHWRMLAPDDLTRRNGVWRVTDGGVAWLQGRATVPQFAHIWGNACLGFSGDWVSFTEASTRPVPVAKLIHGGE